MDTLQDASIKENVSDKITILTAKNRLTKKIHPEGVEAYGNAKHFKVYQESVNSITQLSEKLTQLEHEPFKVVIRGEPRFDISNNQQVRRTTYPKNADGTFVSICRYWVMLDLDSIPFPPGMSHANTSSVDIAKYAIFLLPEEFKNVTCHYQFSSSAGIKEGIRIHLWFWLNRPVTDLELKTWAENL